jgi:outer membrane protein OmpA-like peptidoglycan-associated protein
VKINLNNNKKIMHVRMKRIVNLLFVLVLLTFAFPALAQEESDLSEIALRKTHSDNWYVSVGPSVNILFGEQDQLQSVLKRIKFGGELSVGKWLNSNIGLSLNLAGGGFRGFNTLNAPFEAGYYTSDEKGPYHGIHLYKVGSGLADPGYDLGHPMGGPFTVDGKPNTKYKYVDNGFWQDFNFFAPTFNLMFNLTNLSRGYAVEKGWFELIGFIGIGGNFAFDNGYSTPDFFWLAGRAGLRANFNVTKNIAAYLQTTASPTDPEFDGYKGTALGDLYNIWSVGVQYTFNKKVRSPFEEATIDNIDRLNRRVNENRDLIENHQDILERQQSLLDKLGNNLSSGQTQKNIPVVHKHAEHSVMLPEYIRFAFDSYTVERSESGKINTVVNFLKNNPDSKILLVGYADKKTGTSTYNYNLSKKRVEAVVAEIKRLGIDGSRLVTEWKGDVEQPFASNEWNRVVIIVERK